MNKIKFNLCRLILHQSVDRGFSLSEVLISILTLSCFFLGSLQATVYSAFIRVQAQDKQETVNWLQQDIDLIRYQAFILDSTTMPTGLTVSKTDACNQSRYGERLQDFIDDANEHPTTMTVSIDNRNYFVTRNYTPRQNILQITHTINYASTHPRYKGASNNNQIAQLTTEVLPDVVLTCS